MDFIFIMSKLHYLDLDGRSLRLLLSLLDTRSATESARRLGLTQSGVSHALERLRSILGDPLFVRAGRGLEPTDHALSLADAAQDALALLEGIGQEPVFDPATSSRRFVIAANDYQRDILLPVLFRHLQRDAPGIRLRIRTPGLSGGDMLRDRDCDLLISPKAPDLPDLVRTSLYTDRFVCFYDANCREAPDTLERYLASGHITIVYSNDEDNPLDLRLAAQGMRRRVVLNLPNFSALPAFLRGTPLVVASLEQSYRMGLGEFARCPLPLPTPPVPLYAIWHIRDTVSPAHRWFRELLRRTVRELGLPDGS